MWVNKLYICVAYLVIISKCGNTEGPAVWKWVCDAGKCVKQRNDPSGDQPALSLEACQMFCYEYGLLWPMPTGATHLGNFVSKINLNNVEIKNIKRGKSDDLVDAAGKRFKDMISKVVLKGVTPKATGKLMEVYIVNQNPNIRAFDRNLDESYDVKVSLTANDRVNATVTGKSFFGVRHGLETLSQLVIYDDIRDLVLVVRDVNISDKPVYPYRGILLDTARNYYNADAIKSTMDAMAAVKLNTFHWHISDSQSFPFVSSRRPNMTKFGAYSPSKVYTADTIREIVRFGLERGVRVMPEFDAPAHAGEGWQETNMTVCFKAEPYKSFCAEPPCGQLNPTKEELYQYLEDIYKDMADAFNPDMFHMGGDEVSGKCWNSSEEIRHFMTENDWGLTESSYLKLWKYFQTQAQYKVYKAFGKKLPLILWTSRLTDYNHVEKYLNNHDYIIQVWKKGIDPQIRVLLEKGYRLIISNYDALYFDCGFGAWLGISNAGNNWCSPYIGWQKVYNNSPAVMALQYRDQILGGEAALWSEQSDTATLDGRLWPRAAAMAERLWAEPATTWVDAEYRMLHVRERLVRMGIQAESLEPEWCYQNDGYCYLGST